ncbi:radical SAM/SPASM domain-containing protein [Haliangium ochraceum]|uniref:Radical SAM domain protein n=1 Tax=Haliangium ochraceum (strain DSM 14365 / JCM 11303 / SMP-2) TaxID=502025 RepID=D0LK51_HALO1|nr:radical SAM protein [Haliangium ochraceum]ACY13085.1 Radical SAM domain protein [Haliangium ochraceum DSM 14365]
MKSHRGAADVLAEMARRQNRPITVTFQVTDRCNYECVHCYQTHGQADELSFDEIADILRQLADFGVLFLSLMGGEFFMRRDADDILRLAHELGFAIKLLTTGHHVGDRRADLLAGLRPLQVDMSMYAAGAHAHDRVTQQPGSWQRTLAAARRLIARKVPVLLKAPVMEGNVAELGALAELARSLGAETSFDAKLTGKEDSDPQPLHMRMRADTLRTFYRGGAGGDNGIDAFLAKTYADFDPARELRPLHHTPCRAGQQAVSITPQGKVWPCNALPIECGDLRERSFAAVWQDSPPLAEVRELRWAAIAECRRCELRSYCQRCHGMALLEQGELRGPSLEACRHAVAVRDSLRERGLIPRTETAMPPTWARVDRDGQHHRRARERAAGEGGARRSDALRVLP